MEILEQDVKYGQSKQQPNQPKQKYTTEAATVQDNEKKTQHMKLLSKPLNVQLFTGKLGSTN